MSKRFIDKLSQAWVKWPGWARQPALAAAYSVVYLYCRQLSFHHWFLPAGIQLLALLLVSYRYWPVLALCSSAFTLPTVIEYTPQFGLWRAALMLVPPIIFVIPLVAWGRSKEWLPDPYRQDSGFAIMPLIGLMVMASLLISAWDICLFLAMPRLLNDPGWKIGLGRFVLGDYLGIVTIVPTGLLAVHILMEMPTHDVRSWWKYHQRKVTSVLISLGFISILYITCRLVNYNELNFSLRACLLVPIGWAAFQLGWRGAAIVGSFSSIALASLTSKQYDITTTQMELIIGFCIAVFLLLGARINNLNDMGLREKEENLRSLALGQQFQQQAEARLQHIGHWLGQASQGLQQLHRRMDSPLSQVLAPGSALQLQNEALTSQLEFHRLVEDIVPPGQVHSLKELQQFLDGLSQTFRLFGVDLYTKTNERLTGLVAPGIVCRLLLEASAYLASRLDRFDRIRICLKYKQTEQQQQMQIHIKASYRASHQETSLDVSRYGMLLERMQRISSTGLKLAAIEYLARLHHGQMQHHYNVQSESLKFSLYDKPRPFNPRIPLGVTEF